MTIKQRFEDGWKEWREFCALQDDYPDDSFVKLMLRLKLKIEGVRDAYNGLEKRDKK